MSLGCIAKIKTLDPVCCTCKIFLPPNMAVGSTQKWNLNLRAEEATESLLGGGGT